MGSKKDKLWKSSLWFVRKLWYNVKNYNKKEVNEMGIAENTAIYGEIDSIDFAAYLNKKAKDEGLEL